VIDARAPTLYQLVKKFDDPHNRFYTMPAFYRETVRNGKPIARCIHAIAHANAR